MYMKYKSDLLSIIRIICFACLLFVVFTFLTNLYRPQRNDTMRMNNIYREKGLDVVYIGGSTAHVYWQPLKAYSDYGFTSACYSTNSFPPEGTKWYMREAYAMHNPRLFIVELRQFAQENFDNTFRESALRNGTDGMRWFSPYRIGYIFDYISKHKDGVGENAISNILFDITLNHNNEYTLSRKENWMDCDDYPIYLNKGYEFVDAYDSIDHKDFVSETEAEVDEQYVRELEHLLDYCDGIDSKVLFVFSPCNYGESDMTRYKVLENIVENRGYDCVNTNQENSNISMDYNMDFYNGAHVNCLGAKKYTEYIDGFVVEKYQIPDHREDERYSSWNESAKQFLLEQNEHEEIQRKLREEYIYSMNRSYELKKYTNLDDWCRELDAERYYFFVYQSKEASLDLSSLSELSKLGIRNDKGNMCGVYSSDITNDDIVDETISGTIFNSERGHVSYKILTEDVDVPIEINNIQYGDREVGDEGTIIVVFNKSLWKVVDIVNIHANDYESKIHHID